MTNQITGIIIGVILIILLFAIVITPGGDYRKVIKENKELRNRLENEMKNVEGLRNDIAKNNEQFENEIKKSARKVDSLERSHKKREEKLRKDLNRLKGTNLKDLQDEADSIYSANCKY
jgi:F0F1-type ATP synthase membrane subunit b/b'